MAVIDLSHTIRDGLFTYPGLPGPRITEYAGFDETASGFVDGSAFSIAEITMVANTGTYMDTPAHRYPDGDDLSAVPLERSVDLPGTVIDASSRNERAVPASMLPECDLEGHAVLIRTDWSSRFGTEAYIADAPYVSNDLCEAMIHQGVAIVGIDSLNIDRTDTGERPVHSRLLAAGILPVEHLTNLAALDSTAPFRFFAAAPRIVGMATFPVRAFAIQ